MKLGGPFDAEAEMKRGGPQLDESRPGYSCFQAHCPGEHRSKWEVCNDKQDSIAPGASAALT